MELVFPDPSDSESLQAPSLKPRADAGEGFQEKYPLTSAESEIIWGINEYTKYRLKWPDLKLK